MFLRCSRKIQDEFLFIESLIYSNNNIFFYFIVVNGELDSYLVVS